MPFSISFCDTPLVYEYDDPTTAGTEGLLVIGEWRESFLSSLYEWTKQDYERQWQAAINSLVQGAEKSALITEFVGPEASSHLQWWPLYRLGGTVYFHNQILFYDQLSEPFSLADISKFVSERQTVNEDGAAISEWSIPLSALEEFARNSGWTD